MRRTTIRTRGNKVLPQTAHVVLVRRSHCLYEASYQTAMSNIGNIEQELPLFSALRHPPALETTVLDGFGSEFTPKGSLFFKPRGSLGRFGIVSELCR